MIPFPFTAIVGMESAKRSLIFHAIDPKIGGALLLGHRGCAKSTLVRGFAEILAAEAPFVELPLGTSEDRLLGSVNSEALVETGRWQIKNGLIAQAHGGVLYIDEINLLPDHLADLILDSAASGQYRMERDGITQHVESRYVLVGTMNPEEGDLRPQLSDRFGHGVRVSDDFNAQERVTIVERRMAFDDAPQSFVAEYVASTHRLKERIQLARLRMTSVAIPAALRLAIAEKARALHLEGIRAELAVVRTARCAAAWESRVEVTEQDIEEAWILCLGHRENPPTAAPPNPPATRRDSAPREQQSQVTSQAPLSAQREAVPVVAQSTAGNFLSQPTQSPVVRNQGGQTTLEVGGSIAWLCTLQRGFCSGWRPGLPGLTLIRAQRSQRKNVWCFIDASRSTGASGFLGKARGVLASMSSTLKAARFHLLVLENGTLRWRTRGTSQQGFGEALQTIQQAQGKSLILQSLKELQRARLRRRAPDLVLVATDGLSSPAAGESMALLQSRLQSAFFRLTQGSQSVTWLQPSSKRGLASWIPRICRGLKIRSMTLG